MSVLQLLVIWFSGSVSLVALLSASAARDEANAAHDRIDSIQQNLPDDPPAPIEAAHDDEFALFKDLPL